MPLLTAGNDVADLARFLKPGTDSYTAADVVAYLLKPIEEGSVPPNAELRASSAV